MKTIITFALLCASINIYAGCKASNLYGHWLLLTADKNQTILRCHLYIDKKGIKPISECLTVSSDGNQQTSDRPKNSNGIFNIVGCNLSSFIQVGDIEYSFDAIMNQSHNQINGILFPNKSIVTITKD